MLISPEEREQLKVELKKEILMELSKKSDGDMVGKEYVFRDLKDKYRKGLFNKYFNPDSYGSLETWESCIRITNHICENYKSTVSHKFRIASSIPRKEVEANLYVMSRLCETVLELQKYYNFYKGAVEEKSCVVDEKG